jgi:hypothetical protein
VLTYLPYLALIHILLSRNIRNFDNLFLLYL